MPIFPCPVWSQNSKEKSLGSFSVKSVEGNSISRIRWDGSAPSVSTRPISIRDCHRKLSQEFVKNLKSVGVTIVYTLVNWSDWDLLKFFRAMGFSRGGEMINLELNLDS